MATLYLVGVAGVLSLGLAAPSLWWLMGSLVVANVLLPARGAQAMMVAAVVAMAGAAVGFTMGWLDLSVDPNAYVREPTAWATLLLGTGGLWLWCSRPWRSTTGPCRWRWNMPCCSG